MAEVIDCAEYLRDAEVECFDDKKETVRVEADCWRCQLKSFDWAEATLGVKIRGAKQQEVESEETGPLGGQDVK